MKLYAGAIYGYKDGMINISPIYLLAENKRMADGLAWEQSSEFYPTNDGWSNVGFVLTEIKNSYLKQAIFQS